MYYEVLNGRQEERPWVLFIHGFGGSSRTWKYQIESFWGDYNILVVDLPGHGASESEEVDNKNPHTHVSHMIHEILVKEKIDKVNIVSMSLGTIVAIEFVRLYPESVETVILGGGSFNLTFKSRMLLRIANVVKYLMPTGLTYRLFAHILLPKSNHKKSRDIFIRESKKLNANMFKVWIQIMRMKRKKIQEYVETVINNNVPVLFVSGQEDYMFIKGIRKFHKKVSSTTLEVIEKCGHVCSIEQAEKFNKLAKDFINEKHALLRQISSDVLFGRKLAKQAVHK